MGKTSMKKDIFICHASEDKVSVARPLATCLADRGLTYCIDEAEILEDWQWVLLNTHMRTYSDIFLNIKTYIIYIQVSYYKLFIT